MWGLLASTVGGFAACFSPNPLRNQPCTDDSECGPRGVLRAERLVCQPDERVCRPEGEFCGDGVLQEDYEACEGDDSGALPDGCHGCRKGAEQLAVGGYHSCVLRGGEVYCWGRNDDGQLGVGSRERVYGVDGSLPARVLIERAEQTPEEPVVQLAPGLRHTCALHEGGRLTCWGHPDSSRGLENLQAYGDELAELPLRSFASAMGFPNEVEYPATAIASGWSHVCVALEIPEGADELSQVECWGLHNHIVAEPGFEYASGDYKSIVANYTQFDGERVRALTAGAVHTCALMESSEVVCWGGNHLGQVRPEEDPSELCRCRCSERIEELQACEATNRFPGGGGCTESPTEPPTDLPPTQPPTEPDPNPEPCDEPAEGEPGSGGCFGASSSIDVAMFGGAQTVDEIVAGGFHTCARLDGGSGMGCWGSNAWFQLGASDVDARNSGRLAFAGATIVQIAAGAHHTCVLLEREGAREVRCWGYNRDGQLGVYTPDFAIDSADAAQPVSLGEGRVHSISAGAFHTCALFVDGRVRCWGRGTDGQLGGGCATLIGDEPGDMPPRSAWVFADNPPPIWPALHGAGSCREVDCIGGDCPGGVCSDGEAPALRCPELGVPYRSCEDDGEGVCAEDGVCARGCPIQREEVFYVPTAQQYWSGCVPAE